MGTDWSARNARQVRRSLEDMLDRRVSQIELSEWLRYGRTAIQNWESGRTEPDPAVQFLYWKLLADPGFINEIKQWSKSTDAPSE